MSDPFVRGSRRRHDRADEPEQGKKIPTTNMTQWPFLIVMIPRVIRRTTYKIPTPNHSMR
jgi:hypothetical protein